MKMQRRSFLAFTSASLIGGLVETLVAEDVEKEFVSLFDGQSFAGWEGDLKTFRIEDGAIIGGTMKEKIPRNEFLCTTRPFGLGSVSVYFSSEPSFTASRPNR